MVDNTVTLYDSITYDKPKLLLKHIFELVVFLSITKIIGEWHPGYIHLIQDKNDVPRKYVYFKNW